jgi:hypothetical protein
MKKFDQYIKEGTGRQEGTGLGADGLSKARLKTLLYKETKKCTYNKLYKDTGWNGPHCIWNVFNDLNLAWNLVSAEYKKVRGEEHMMPTYKEWIFEIHWNSKEGGMGRQMKMGGTVTASGAGSVKDPLDRYDVNMVLW